MKRIVFTILTMTSLLMAGEFISINSAKKVLTYVDVLTVEKLNLMATKRGLF